MIRRDIRRSMPTAVTRADRAGRKRAAPKWRRGFDLQERETGLEPATFSLEG
jgi:hypothetical protein